MRSWLMVISRPSLARRRPQKEGGNRIAGKISNAEDRDLRRIVEITHAG
jgi:hypothetical protein